MKVKATRYEGLWIIYDRGAKRLHFSPKRLDEGVSLAIGRVIKGACNGRPIEYWIEKMHADRCASPQDGKE